MQTYERTQWIDDWSCKLMDEPPHRLLKCFSNLSRNFGLEFHLSPVYLPTMEINIKRSSMVNNIERKSSRKCTRKQSSLPSILSDSDDQAMITFEPRLAFNITRTILFQSNVAKSQVGELKSFPITTPEILHFLGNLDVFDCVLQVIFFLKCFCAWGIS